jgi:predicted nucleic acid-binding protein
MIATPVRCVVDASVAMKLVLAEPDSAQADALFAHLDLDPAALFFVPDFFFLECTSVLRKATKKGLCTPAEAKARLARVEGLRLNRIGVTSLTGAALDLAVTHDLSAYDAAYVAASAQALVPLITADDKLVRKLAGTAHEVYLLSALTIPPPPPPTSAGS